jgi:hypothetical protein
MWRDSSTRLAAQIGGGTVSGAGGTPHHSAKLQSGLHEKLGITCMVLMHCQTNKKGSNLIS